MRILGIDPGIGRTGWGTVTRFQMSDIRVQTYGCIETEVGVVMEKRLEILYKDLTRILTEYSPDSVAVEDLFFNTNAKTALVVGQARGVILLAAAQAHIPVAVYTPLQVKIAVAGYGRADKKQVGQMVKTILKLSTIPKPDDTADALAIALTHAFSYKMNGV